MSRSKTSSSTSALLFIFMILGSAALVMTVGVVLSSSSTDESDAAGQVKPAAGRVAAERQRARPRVPRRSAASDGSASNEYSLGALEPAPETSESFFDPTASGQQDAEVAFEGSADLTPQGKIDEFVFERLSQLGIKPSKVCSDAVFLRRAYIDVIGTLPTPQEARDFLADPDPDKRSVLIDDLLERDDFVTYWAMKWCDLLRVKAEFPIKLWPNAAQAYHRWIRVCIKENMPYDQFVREMLTSSGSNFRVPQVNFYRAMQGKDPSSIAQTVALTFMGSRAGKWPEGRLADMAVFFSQVGYKRTAEWKEEIIFFDPDKAAAEASGGAAPTAVFPDGTKAKLSGGRDPRDIFADWLIHEKNPWFTRQIVNRIWYWLLGRGIVHEPDNIRPDNPAQNPELLNWLGQELVKADYDLKHIYRLILNSKTYQLSPIPADDNPDAPANFACYAVRRLDAEVLIDALCQITGTTEQYSSMIPEPFTFIPEVHRTISLPDGSITSSFLEMFGRPPRDTGMAAERNNRMSAGQRLHLLNSSHIRNKIERGPKLKALMQSTPDSRVVAEEVYLAILSRLPTDEEMYFVQTGGSITTVAWALINSDEFLHRH